MVQARSVASLRRNPFFVIGAGPRDRRERIVALADEAALTGDPAASAAARAVLINPRLRLGAEMAWLPGLAPEVTAANIDELTAPLTNDTRITGLARANLLASQIESLAGESASGEAATLIADLALAVESIDRGDVLRAINHDRTISGFPNVGDGELFDEAYWSQRESYRGVVTAFLDRISTENLVGVVGAVVRDATEDGSRPATGLIQEIVKAYDLGLTEFMAGAFRNVWTLAGRVRRLAPFGTGAVQPTIAELKGVVSSFAELAFPSLAVDAMNGIHHPALSQIADQIVPLARHLYGDFEYHDLASDLLKSLASAVPSASPVKSLVAEELEQLERHHDQEKRRIEREAWQTFSTVNGSLARDRVELSPSGISCNGLHIPFDAVTRLRWSGITRRTGRSIASDFTIMVSDGQSSIRAQPANKEIYGEIIDRLWYAVGYRLMIKTVRALKAGASLPFGNITIWDDRVVFYHPKASWEAERTTELLWKDCRIWVAGGAFHIGTGSGVFDAAIPYRDHDNIVVVEHAIRTFFDQGNERISIILRSLG